MLTGSLQLTAKLFQNLLKHIVLRVQTLVDCGKYSLLLLRICGVDVIIRRLLPVLLEIDDPNQQRRKVYGVHEVLVLIEHRSLQKVLRNFQKGVDSVVSD